MRAGFWAPGAERLPATDERLDAAERRLGVALPAELRELLRIRDGGLVADAYDAFPTSRATFSGDTHVPFETLHGVDELLESPYLIGEWWLPSGLVLLHGQGHWWIALDYRTPGEPTVIWHDNEMADELLLAVDFRTFVDGLGHGTVDG